MLFRSDVTGRVAGAVIKRQWQRTGRLLKAGLEILVKSPAILWRRRLEMRSPESLPDLAALNAREGGKP